MPDTTPAPVVVVAAAIHDGDRLLAAKRISPPVLAGRWELPGGKVEPGEEQREALIRECREELGVDVVLYDQIGGDWPVIGFAGGHAVLRVWRAAIVAGEPSVGVSHGALRWLLPDEWLSVPWLDADLPILEALRAELIGR